MTKQKPWNRVNLPVYSFSTKAGDSANMNIATYCIPVSMKPKQIACCFYHNSHSLELISRSEEWVIQYLHEDQYRLVNLLGKQSGNLVPKIQRLEKRGLIIEWEGFPVLSGCLSVVKCTKTKTIPGIDHEIIIGEVLQWKNLREGNPLTLADLKKHAIIR